MQVEIKVMGITVENNRKTVQHLGGEFWFAQAITHPGQLPLTANNFDPVNDQLTTFEKVNHQNALEIFRPLAEATFPFADVHLTI